MLRVQPHVCRGALNSVLCIQRLCSNSIHRLCSNFHTTAVQQFVYKSALRGFAGSKRCRPSPTRPWPCTGIRGTSENTRPYRRTMPRALWGSWGGGCFLMSECDPAPCTGILACRGTPASTSGCYRGTSLIRNTRPPKITTGPQAQGYCKFLRGSFLISEAPL